jgi:hypothetical protein
MTKGASVIVERAGFPFESAVANSDFTLGSLTAITSQHWVFAQDGDHFTASIKVPNTSSGTVSGLYLRMLRLPLIASIKSIFLPPFSLMIIP